MERVQLEHVPERFMNTMQHVHIHNINVGCELDELSQHWHMLWH